MSRWDRKPTWWKTFDYISGKTYILAEQFTGKTAAMGFARSCGMATLPQSTVPITDDQRKIALLENKIKEMNKGKED